MKKEQNKKKEPVMDETNQDLKGDEKKEQVLKEQSSEEKILE